jgi:Tol biopolymer transport system component
MSRSTNGFCQGGKPPERIELSGLGALRPSTSGDRLVFGRSMTDLDIWRFRADGGSEPLIRSSFADANARFSPDGLKVAFCSNRNGATFGIWTSDANGANPTQLTHGPGRNQGSPDSSPDGERVAFDSQDFDRPDAHFETAILHHLAYPDVDVPRADW